MIFGEFLFGVSRSFLAEHVGGPAFAECSGESVAELLIIGFQVADAGGGRLEAAEQRGG